MLLVALPDSAEASGSRLELQRCARGNGQKLVAQAIFVPGCVLNWHKPAGHASLHSLTFIASAGRGIVHLCRHMLYSALERELQQLAAGALASHLREMMSMRQIITL